MNRESFWAGIMMLSLPIVMFVVFAGIMMLKDSGVGVLPVVAGLCALAYVGTAVYLVIRGLSDRE